MIEKQRVDSFDILKGIAIYLVVMGHVLTMCIREIDSAITFKIIGEIHMPIFFFISGYFSFKLKGNQWIAPNLVKRFKQLIIPFFVVSFLWITYFPYSKLQSPLSDNIPDMLCSYWKDGYWFTLTLFELILVYAGMRYVFNKVHGAIAEIFISVLVYVALICLELNFSHEDANFDPLGIGLMTRFFPIFMFGVFAHKYNSRFIALAQNSIVGVLAILLGGFAWYYSVYTWEFEVQSLYMMRLAQPILHISLMLLVFNIVSRLQNDSEHKSALRKSLVYLGKNSLGVYLLHYFFLFPLTPLQEPLRQIGLAFLPTTLVAAFFAFFIVGAALLANYFIEKNKILSFLLIGK